MKKLLGILGTIITAGSGMAGLVGNAPALAKNKINYLQTNNLESLNRSKRTYAERDISNMISFIYLGEITDTRLGTIINAVFRTNGNLPNSLRNRLRIISLSGNRVRLGVIPLTQWTPSSSSETYYGETELTFRINQNATYSSSSNQSSHYDEGYNTNSDEHDEL